jgi:EmrB/QacA subfamily drug resistance transporter
MELAAAALPPTDAAPGRPRDVLAAFSGLMIALLLAALDGTIVATALPTIVRELGGLERLSWVVTAYLLAQTVVTPLYGKLGDIYGRKRVLQVAILLFLAGSALCGLSGGMAQLIAFRALQGLGGGGLLVTAQAVIADLVPPRERGRYQGLFGAAFGVASIAGPLLGGYFTTHLSWRWIFYVNLPLGAAALLVLRATLPAQRRHEHHRIDYAGAASLALLLSGIVLVTDLGGSALAWSSPALLGVAAATGLAGGAFILAERRAAEPVLPLSLFASRSFAVATSVGFSVGFALFGSVTYVPLYLQVVKGSTPTASGLQMIPMMAGMLLASIASGQVISRSGRYKVFPLLGTAIMSAGLFLLSRLDAGSGLPAIMAILLLLGLGLGLIMQVLVIAVQNTIDYERLGVATSGATLFRLVGGSVGTAVLGAIFTARLGHRMGDVGAVTAALETVFLVATAVAVVGFAIAWLLPERPLRTSIAAATAEDPGTDVGQTFAMPKGDDDPLQELLRGVSVLADRDLRRRYMAALVARAGLDLEPLMAWLLMRMADEARGDPVAIGARQGVPAERVGVGLADLQARGLVAAGGGAWSVTAEGCAVARRLMEARRAHLAEACAEWDPQMRAQLSESLIRLARQLVPDVRQG